MPSTSPGQASTPTAFSEILPGAPAASLQATTTFIYRFKRYIVYISGCQLNVLSAPNVLVQAITFPHPLTAVAASPKTGQLIVAGEGQAQAVILEPVAEGWTKISWEKTLLLRRDEAEAEIQCVCWSNEGEALLAGSRSLILFSSLPTSRIGSPRTSTFDGEELDERRPLWSKPVARPVQQATFSPSSTLIATRARYDRLVKIWRRLSFEEGLFDHMYLPHPAAVTHIEWRPLDEHSERRRGSAISRRHEEEHEVLYTIATDGVLRVWRTGGIHDLEMLVLHTSIDLVSAIPDSPSLSANGMSFTSKPARYAVILPCDQFAAALNSAIGLPQDMKINHAKEHLKELVSKEPDVVVVLDGQGRMSAWGLQSIGHKRRPATPSTLQPFHIAHAEGLPLKLPQNTPAMSTAWFQDNKIHLLIHSLAQNGSILWWQGFIELFMSTSAPGADRISLASSWHGVSLDEWSGQLTDSTRRPREMTRSNGDYAASANTFVVEAAYGRRSVTLSTSGQVEVATSTDEHSEPASYSRATYETGIEDGILLAANAEVAALVSSLRMTLSIIDLRDGFIEDCQGVDSIVHSAKCFTLRARQSFVAVAYDTSVDILFQSRYEHDSALMRSWQFVRRISIVDLGVNITGLAWQADGSLAVAAGTALFIAGPQAVLDQIDSHVLESADVPEESKTVQLPVLAHHLSRHLPAWHPSTLERLVLHGHSWAAVYLLKTLASKLKFWSTGDELDHMLGADPQTLLEHTDDSWLDEETANELKDQLDEKELPAVLRKDQRRLGNVIDALLYLRDHHNGLDHNALWYLFTWKLQLLPHQARERQVNTNTQAEIQYTHDHGFVPEMSWREIVMAYHSTSQQPLLDILILHYDNKLTWDIAKRLGIMAWLQDREALMQAFEQMAQTAYRSTSPPDPTHAAIYYLALHKKQTLAALWRIATWHREQRSTTNFLKKDFSQPDAKTAAKKNAYALMGKRRFHYAAAFFLLADNAADACNVLAGQCDDVQFAIAVARLYCSDGSEVLRELLADRILPEAKKDGDRWLMSWCHSVRLEKMQAVEILVQPIEGIVKVWQRDDPATLLLYTQLRKTPSEHEYTAVLRSAKILGRMGLAVLALDVIRSWKFTARTLPTTNGLSNGTLATLPDRTVSEPVSTPAEHAEPPSLLNGFADPAPAQSAPMDEKAAREAEAAELLAKIQAKTNAAKPKAEGEEGGKEEKDRRQPTQFKEPDANSLLDSFGF